MKFVKPEMEKIVFDAEDIIMTSGCDTFACTSVETCPNHCSDCKMVMCSLDNPSNTL